jgi:hypothetical protein
MDDRALELRLAAVARALEEEAPTFDPAALRPPRRARSRRALAAAALVAAVAGVAAAPTAVSAVERFLSVTPVPELGPVAPDVAPPFLGRRVAEDAAPAYFGRRVRTLMTLGEPGAVYIRDDIEGAMATAAYDGGRILLTQWASEAVAARVDVVPSRGVAGDAEIGSHAAVWVAGSARGTLTVIGADGAVHQEEFAVEDGALLWEDGGFVFLLQGAGSKADALRLAAGVG